MKRPVIYVLEAGSISGGVRVVYEHLNRLHARGRHVEVYSLDANRPTWFRLNPAIPWVKFDHYDHLGRHLVKREAIKVATWWRTAQVVAEASRPGEGHYFIQDIEAHYYSAPFQKRQVMETYDLPLVQFTDSIYASDRLGCPFIGLGIDTDVYKPLDLRRQLNSVLALSRPQVLKGWSTLCELYRILFHSHQFTLLSFGTAGVHPPYAGVVPKGIPDEELVRVYNRTGIFVSTSWHEGFSLTPLEAMACGTVVVTPDADGNMVYSRNEENCLLVPPGDAVALADACFALLEDTALMVKLQQGGFETVKEWTWDKAIDKLEAIYNG